MSVDLREAGLISIKRITFLDPRYKSTIASALSCLLPNVKSGSPSHLLLEVSSSKWVGEPDYPTIRFCNCRQSQKEAMSLSVQLPLVSCIKSQSQQQPKPVRCLDCYPMLSVWHHQSTSIRGVLYMFRITQYQTYFNVTATTNPYQWCQSGWGGSSSAAVLQKSPNLSMDRREFLVMCIFFPYCDNVIYRIIFPYNFPILCVHVLFTLLFPI